MADKLTFSGFGLTFAGFDLELETGMSTVTIELRKKPCDETTRHKYKELKHGETN